jgi:hypothetical protein
MLKQDNLIVPGSLDKIYTDADGRMVFDIVQLTRGGKPIEQQGMDYMVRHNGQNQIIMFQNGNPAEVGLNGVTIECLLAIAAHRIGVLNAKCHSDFNVTALEGIKSALAALEARSADRAERGVTGTPTP